METNLRHIPDFFAPQWCFNGHIHTIGRSLTGDNNIPEVQRIEIPTPDDDFLELDCAIQADSKAIVTLFHGLEGSSQRFYIVELMKVLLQRGFSAVAVNFRSCGSRLNNQPRFYHSGETGDYATVFNWIRGQYPNQKLGAVGFSLGGNALLMSLAEKNAGHPVDCAAAVSVPYDLYLGAKRLSRGFHRVYEYRFLRTLCKKLELKRQTYPELPTFTGSTLFEFDNQVTAPIHGFEGAIDYYEQCSSCKIIEDIRTPTLLIHSRQDPMCPIEAMPIGEIFENKFTDYIITEEGGHVGFWSRPQGWLNYVIGNYLDKKLLLY
ncbi:MAG: alpha/beta fold hydrolase [Balneolaceae bacterium]|jgi:predicted alpha/beta-fold hydrolase